MGDESYLKTLAVLALKREGIEVKSDQVGVVTRDGDYRAPAGDGEYNDGEHPDPTVRRPFPMRVWATLPDGTHRVWNADSRLQMEDKLRAIMEGR